MAYITNADVEERLGTPTYIELTDDAGTGVADPDKVDEARMGAEGEVDSYLGRRYGVPVDVEAHPELGGLLKSITLDLAVYRLYSRRPPVPEDVRSQRDRAAQWLAAAAEGRVVLPAEEELGGPTTGGIVGQAGGSERMLSRATMEDL